MKSYCELSKAEVEIIFRALSAASTDEMRYQAWELLDRKIKTTNGEHVFQFYANGSFCSRCGQMLGTAMKCI